MVPSGTGSAFAGLARVEITRGIVDELRPASGRAEIVGPPLVLGAMLGCVRIDVHPAHRVLHPVLRPGSRSGTVVVSMLCMIMTRVPVTAARSGLFRHGLLGALRMELDRLGHRGPPSAISCHPAPSHRGKVNPYPASGYEPCRGQL